MKTIYKKIWELAKPYYRKARPTDIEHIEWMIKEAQNVCKKEKIDESLLLPLVILHDIGYSKVAKENPFSLKLRNAHMKTGKEMAKNILKKVNYPREKVKKIAYYVSIHDVWAFGKTEIYKKDKILGVFTDLDFVWMATRKGFAANRKVLRKNKKKMVTYLKTAKSVPFATKTTKKIYEQYLNRI